MDAFELLNSTLPLPDLMTGQVVQESSFISSIQENNLSWSVWSWGSNSNYLLGSEKKDPSLVFPQKATISLPDAIGFKQVKDLYAPVLQVVLSKYHSCIVTSSGLYTCGFGKKGRLGLGNEDSVLKPVKVDIKDVQFVGLGPDHTLAVTFNGDLWSWGNNENGTLGYLLDESFQSEPKLVTHSSLKKIKVLT
jgi:alpha-tubulin suppressor-like RCC1 family protein